MNNELITPENVPARSTSTSSEQAPISGLPEWTEPAGAEPVQRFELPEQPVVQADNNSEVSDNSQDAYDAATHTVNEILVVDPDGINKNRKIPLHRQPGGLYGREAGTITEKIDAPKSRFGHGWLDKVLNR